MKYSQIKKIFIAIVFAYPVMAISAQPNWKPDDSKGFIAHDPVMIKMKQA